MSNHVIAVSPPIRILPVATTADCECVECGDLLTVNEAVRCTCGFGLCEDCYVEWQHHNHDRNPDNDWLRGILNEEVAHGTDNHHLQCGRGLATPGTGDGGDSDP